MLLLLSLVFLILIYVSLGHIRQSLCNWYLRQGLCKKKAHMHVSFLFTQASPCIPIIGILMCYWQQLQLQLFSSYRIPFQLRCCSQSYWLLKSESNTGYSGICHQMISMLSQLLRHHLKYKVLASFLTGSHHCFRSWGCSELLDIQHMHQQPAWGIIADQVTNVFFCKQQINWGKACNNYTTTTTNKENSSSMKSYHISIAAKISLMWYYQ